MRQPMKTWTISNQSQKMCEKLQETLYPFLQLATTQEYNPEMPSNAWHVQATVTLASGALINEDGLTEKELQQFAELLNKTMKDSLSEEMFNKLMENHNARRSSTRRNYHRRNN